MAPFHEYGGESTSARQNHVLDAIVTYRFLAPAYLAHEERREQALAALTLAPLGDEATDLNQHPATHPLWAGGASLARRWRCLAVSVWRRLRRRPFTDHAKPVAIGDG